MTIPRFHHLAQTHGADIERWPTATRAAARDLLARSDKAQRILAEAAELDHWLDRATQTTDASVERLMAAIDRRIDAETSNPFSPIVPPARSQWSAVGFLACMAVLGFLAGDPALLHQPESQMHFADFVAPSSYLVSWNQ